MDHPAIPRTFLQAASAAALLALAGRTGGGTSDAVGAAADARTGPAHDAQRTAWGSY